MGIKKSDIAKSISSNASISYALSKDILNSLVNIIKLNSNKFDIKIAKFGTFSNRVTPQRIGRNPKTGEEHLITERVKLNFVASNKIKNQLN